MNMRFFIFFAAINFAFPHFSDAQKVAAGGRHSLAICSDSTVQSWGYNGFGQFGNGSNQSSKTPVQVAGLSGIVQISAGEWHSIFVKNDGAVFSSGRNQYGQLGDGSIADKNTAAPITALSGIVQAEAGGIHSVFVKNDGSVWACGLNSGGNNDGQLGDGTAIDRSTPVQVVATWGSGKIARAEATREHSLFLHENGAIWGAGRNNYGQLGNGKFESKNALLAVQAAKVCAVPTVSMVEHEKNGEALAVFPNPSSGKFTIHFLGQQFRARLTTASGKHILQTDFLDENLPIDLENQPEGLYFLEVQTLGKRIFKKVLLQKN